jgi:uncharacterized membrane-anchored protein
MTNHILRLLCCFTLALSTVHAAEPRTEKDDEAKAKKAFEAFIAKLKWTKGPTEADLGAQARIKVPEGFKLADAASTKELMEAYGNRTSGSELGLLAPESLDWFVIFRFSDDGYVKDDDKDKLDADVLLKSFKEGTEKMNEERKSSGIPPLKIIGWDIPPKYNEKTHNLEWAIRAESQGEPVVNYNTRILGRKGVMELKLVGDADKMAEMLPHYQQIIAGYSYKTGETYAEYKPGDKVAKYGLTALVLGGAAIGAAKLGLFATLAMMFKKMWKLVILGLAAVAAGIKKLFSGRSKETE